MASTRKASIAAELRADRSKFKADLDAAKKDVKAFGNDIRRESGNFVPGGTGFASGMKSVIGKYQHLRQVVTDLTGLAVRSAGAPAMLNDMTDALKAVTGSAEEAKQAMDFLAGVAEEQKLEFEPLAEAYERMRALGYSAQQTRDFIREMGNAIETAGGDAGDLTGVVSALSKIQDKGELSAKALHQMGESMPFLRKIMQEQFGANTAAELEELNLSMEELFDGIVRGLQRVETNKGSTLDALSPEYIASMNRLRLGRAGMGDSPVIPDLPGRTPGAADPDGDAARIKMLRERAAAAKSAAEQEKKLAEAMEAEAEAKKKAGEAWDEEQKQIAAQKEFAAEATGDLAVAKLRGQGKNEAADKLEKDLAEKRRAKELMESGGMGEAEAAAFAAQERSSADDQSYLDSTGKKKIKGAKFKTGFTGIPGFADKLLKDEWQFKALDEGKEFRKRPSRFGKGQGGPADPGAAAVREQTERLEKKLDQLIQANGKTTAEKLKRTNAP